MELELLTKELHQLFESNRLGRALALLKRKLNIESARYNTLLIIARRYNKHLDESMAGVQASGQETTIELNRIGQALLQFIDTLEESDLGSGLKLSHHEVSNQIAVFSEEVAPESLELFFKRLNFTNVKAFNAKDFDEIKDEKFDLIIFDNRDLPPCHSKQLFDKLEPSQRDQVEGRIAKMQEIISTTAKFLIHYGDFLYWISSKANRKRIQPANSQFSLYARTKEVIEFINTYRV
ncbi:MAG: hypothetical protein AAF798_10785 [Bacteroidota bacterium]